MSSVDDACGGCDWYGTACADKKCHGDGCIRYRARTRGFVYSRLEGEYRKIRSKNPEFVQSYCLSRLEKKVPGSQISVSA
jgi:hypothetical protein